MRTLTGQLVPPHPLINGALPPKKTLMNPQSFKTTWSEGREVKHFCDLVGVSIQGNKKFTH